MEPRRTFLGKIGGALNPLPAARDYGHARAENRLLGPKKSLDEADRAIFDRNVDTTRRAAMQLLAKTGIWAGLIGASAFPLLEKYRIARPTPPEVIIAEGDNKREIFFKTWLRSKQRMLDMLANENIPGGYTRTLLDFYETNAIRKEGPLDETSQNFRVACLTEEDLAANFITDETNYEHTLARWHMQNGIPMYCSRTLYLPPLEVIGHSTKRYEFLKIRNDLPNGAQNEVDFLFALHDAYTSLAQPEARWGNERLAEPLQLYKQNMFDGYFLPEAANEFAKMDIPTVPDEVFLRVRHMSDQLEYKETLGEALNDVVMYANKTVRIIIAIFNLMAENALLTQTVPQQERELIKNRLIYRNVRFALAHLQEKGITGNREKDKKLQLYFSLIIWAPVYIDKVLEDLKAELAEQTQP